MPPKKTFSSDNYSISSASSRIRSNVAGDLITKSQAALSSQASVYTQRSNASQEGMMMNFGMGENQDIQFNREQIGEVFITPQQQEVIQKILQLARKGKVNMKNAFQIPIKVVHSEANTSINNKFWKFASQLLDASMYIYDKRVENMYVSIGAFQNKLSRIGFSIKDKRPEQQQKLDDVNADQQIRRSKNREERQMMLKISADDFSGALNLDNKEIIGFQTIQKKEKLDIKNIENKFIADPTFQKTQKLFDSFSLRSLMLNIFNLSTNLNVGLFHKSDLEQDSNENFYKSTNITSQNMFMKQKSFSQQFSNKEIQIANETQSQAAESQNTQSVANKNHQQHDQQTNQNQNNNANIDYDGQSLSYELEKHLNQTKNLIKQKPLLQEITNFISKQPQLKKDYYERHNMKNNRKGSQIQIDQYNQNQQKQNNNIDITYGEIIEKQRIQFIELFKEFHQTMQQEFGMREDDNNDVNNNSGLYQAHQTQSENLQQQQSNFMNSFNHNSAVKDYLETNSMPISFEESFFSWDEQNNIIEPIMPWQIQFKNLKLTKKRKKPQKGQSKKSKKSNKQSAASIVDFGLGILDRGQVLKSKDAKKSFQGMRVTRRKQIQKNCQPKQHDVVHTEYHMTTMHHSRGGVMGIAQRQSFRKSINLSKSQHNPDIPSSFVFDLDDSVHPIFEDIKKQHQAGVSQEETRLYDGEGSYNTQQGVVGGGMFFHSSETNSKGVSYFGTQMGVNNIRQIKKIIVSEVNQKGRTTLQQINRLMYNLSPQQLFTIFLHLTNEHQFSISNEDGDQSTIILSQARRQGVSQSKRGEENRRRHARGQQLEI